MREILFRGKRIDNGKWIKGFYYERLNPFTEDGHPVKYFIADVPPFANEIYQETIGQFTGLVDKNGKKVFEGDILSIECYDGGSLFEPSCTWHENAEVIWSQEHFGWYAKFADEELSLWEYDDSKTIEVIGNIHDDPELMEVKKR